MSMTMDSGIELMSENSTMDGSFLTDTWEYTKVKGDMKVTQYMKVRGERGKRPSRQGRSTEQAKPEGERQKKPARDRTNVEDWKIRGKREVGQRMNIGGKDGERKTGGERINVEVELHNLKLDDLEKMDRKKGEKTQETSLKGKVFTKLF